MDCSFVQLNVVVDPEVIYRDYIYVTTSSSGLDRHFSKYCKDVCDYLSYAKNKLVVDIGSNDGTLLKHFKQKKHRVVGVEPAIEISKKANEDGIETYPHFFDKDLAERMVSENGNANLITANNLFANIDDLHAFMQAADVLLSQDGVLVIESSYLYKMIKKMVFDFIYHEHISYLSATPLEAFMKSIDMHVIHIQEVPTKGGSLRYYCARLGSEWAVDASVEKIMESEHSEKQLRTVFQQYSESIENQKMKLRSYLQAFDGKKVVGYGASATSTTLISHFGLHEHLNYLVDDNPGKIDTYSPGYHIPVDSPEKLRQDPPDVLIILAWRFKDEILRKIEDLSCGVVLPLPQFYEVQ
jgi:2-polyprenyl-3-methyl-5-hydroxy-6-metoxy-1,4-benzoquinol methylase